MLNGAWCGGMSAGGWILMAVFWVAFLALLVWAVGSIFPRSSRSTGMEAGLPPNPRELLDQRLASGDIDIQTCRRLRDELDAPVA